MGKGEAIATAMASLRYVSESIHTEILFGDTQKKSQGQLHELRNPLEGENSFLNFSVKIVILMMNSKKK